jgi:hypothetical protein
MWLHLQVIFTAADAHTDGVQVAGCTHISVSAMAELSDKWQHVRRAHFAHPIEFVLERNQANSGACADSLGTLGASAPTLYLEVSTHCLLCYKIGARDSCTAVSDMQRLIWRSWEPSVKAIKLGGVATHTGRVAPLPLLQSSDEYAVPGCMLTRTACLCMVRQGPSQQVSPLRRCTVWTGSCAMLHRGTVLLTCGRSIRACSPCTSTHGAHCHPYSNVSSSGTLVAVQRCPA